MIDTIIAVRTADVAASPGSVIERSLPGFKCYKCGANCTLAPTGQAAVATGFRVICIFCFEPVPGVEVGVRPDAPAEIAKWIRDYHVNRTRN